MKKFLFLAIIAIVVVSAQAELDTDEDEFFFDSLKGLSMGDLKARVVAQVEKILSIPERTRTAIQNTIVKDYYTFKESVGILKENGLLKDAEGASETEEDSNSDAVDSEEESVSESDSDGNEDSDAEWSEAIEEFEGEDPNPGPTPFVPPKAGTDIGKLAEMAAGMDPEVGAVVDSVVAIGKQAWTIVEENKAVVKVDEPQEASAVPAGATPFQLGGFSEPRYAKYVYTATNGFGIDVVTCHIQVTFQYGGSYQGKGKYLTSVMVQVVELDVAWGMDYTASASVESVSNIGSVEDPIAGMLIHFHCQISTVLSNKSMTAQWFLRGDSPKMKLLGR